MSSTGRTEEEGTPVMWEDIGSIFIFCGILLSAFMLGRYIFPEPLLTLTGCSDSITVEAPAYLWGSSTYIYPPIY